MCAAEVLIFRSGTHCLMSKAYKSDIISPCIVIHHDPKVLMSALFLKKQRSPSLAPQNSRTFICNSCTCLVHVPPVTDLPNPASQPSRLALVYIVASTDIVFRRFVAVRILFSHQISFKITFYSVEEI